MPMSVRPLEKLPPTEALELENGLALVPRVRLILTVYPAQPSSSTKPIDEWNLKLALIDFLKTSLTVSVAVPEEDLEVRRVKDTKKRKRDDPVAYGTLCIRDLGFLKKRNRKRSEEESRGDEEEEEEDVKAAEEKFLEWRKYVAEKMDGIQVNLEGQKYKLSVAVPASDDFEGMKKAWEKLYAFENRGYSRRGGGRQEPDTVIISGVPSRWFAEPRVSSKPSLLVTHTIFSAFGKIRNLNVSEDDTSKDLDEDAGDIISGLHCKIVVQFEKHKDFLNALRTLCGRSLQKQGSRMKADYEVTWDKGGFFRNSRSLDQERSSRMPAGVGGYHRDEVVPRREPHTSQFSSDDTRRKRFKE